MTTDHRQFYFPSGSLDPDPEANHFLEEWFTKALVALDERPLYPSPVNQALEIRFLCLPTWRPACSIRVQLGVLPRRIAWRELDGPESGFDLGELAYRSDRVLTDAEVRRLTMMWEYLRFWELPAAANCDVLDGTMSVLEGRENGKYHVICRDTSEWGDTFEELTHLLFKLCRIAAR